MGTTNNSNNRKRQDGVMGTDPVASAYAPKAITGEVVEKRPARNRHHPHPSPGDFYRVQTAPLETLPKMTAPVEPHGTERHREALERNMALLPPEARRSEDEIYSELIESGEKPMNAAKQAHMEIAAAKLAVGGTYAEAANDAGVSEATVASYMDSDVFLARIRELRGHVMEEIAGNVVQELKRRTSGDNIVLLETIDVLRIYDRTGGTKSPAGQVAPTVNVQVNTYQDLVGAVSKVLAAEAAQSDGDAQGKGGDFPTYGPDVVPVPGGSSLRIGKVPSVGLGSAGRQKRDRGT